VAAYAQIIGEQRLVISLLGLVISENGKKVVKVTGQGVDALQLGNQLAQEAILQGASEILALGSVK
jgi:hypothetical protein